MKNQPARLYRVEDPKGKHGLWRDFDGRHNPVFDKLSEGLVRSMPMDDDFATYNLNGKQWFASAPSKETLSHWFSQKDIEELLALGYGIFEFQASEVRVISPYESVFTRESIISQRELPPDELFAKWAIAHPTAPKGISV